MNSINVIYFVPLKVIGYNVEDLKKEQVHMPEEVIVKTKDMDWISK